MYGIFTYVWLIRMVNEVNIEIRHGTKPYPQDCMYRYSFSSCMSDHAPCSTNSFCICDLIWLKNWQKGALRSFLWYHCLGTCGCEFSNNWLTASVHNFGPTRNTLVWAPLCFVCGPSISITLRHCHNQIGLRFMQQPLCQVSPFATSCTVPEWILP